MLSNRFLYGFMAGAAVTASGYYVYNRNKDKIDALLRSQGINVPASSPKDFTSMKLEELIATKERIEDLIAEVEFARKQTESGI